MKNQDVKLIRLVGGFSFGLGLALILATAIAAVALVYAASTSATPLTILELSQLVLSLGMALTLTACGSQIVHFNPPLVTDVQSLRLGWTALFVGMVIAAIIGANLMPSLGFIALADAILLLGIRPAVIRASGL